MRELITDLPFPVTFHFKQKVYDDDSIMLSLDHEIADNLTLVFNYPVKSKDTSLNPILYFMINVVTREMYVRDELSQESSLDFDEPKTVEIDLSYYDEDKPSYFEQIISAMAQGFDVPEQMP